MKFRVFRNRVEYVYSKLPPYAEVFPTIDTEQDEADAVFYAIFRSAVEWVKDCLINSGRESAEIAMWHRDNREGGWTIQAKMLPEKT